MRHKITFLLGLVVFLSEGSINPSLTTSSSTLSTSEPVFDVEKELTKVVDFTEGLEVLYEVYNSSVSETESFEIIGNNFKKIMQASRKCGIALHQGLHIFELTKYFEAKKEDNKELLKLQNFAFDLQSKVYMLSAKNSYAFNEVQRINYLSYFETWIENPFDTNCDVFGRLLDDIFHSSINKDYSGFKDNCKVEVLIKAVDYVENKNDFEYYMIRSDYIDGFTKLAIYPMCDIFNNGLPNSKDAYAKSQEFIDIIQRVNKRFKELSAKRKEMYWSNDNIFNVVKKHVLGDITFDGPYTGDNNIIAGHIYGYLAENYRSFGYTYHVGVSNSGTNGNADALIHCSVDCKYIYGINNKDVYIIRNKRTPVYQECNFLKSKNDFRRVTFFSSCSTSARDSTDLTELADQIQSECNSTAFSLVRSRLNYQSASDDGESVYVNNKFKKLPSGFSQKCFDDIYVVMAKNY